MKVNETTSKKETTWNRVKETFNNVLKNSAGKPHSLSKTSKGSTDEIGKKD